MRMAATIVGIGILVSGFVSGETPMKIEANKDKEAILGHIHGIFQAFLRKDREAIRRMHREDWVGFQGPSVKIERGLADYMVNAEKSLQNLDGLAYELLDTEVQVFGDIALVYYVARYDYRDKVGQTGSLPLRSIDVYRRENSEWNQAGSHIGIIPQTANWGEKSEPAKR